MHEKRHPFEARLGDWPDERLGIILAKRVANQLRYFPAEIEMDMAHTVMLAEQEIIGRDEAASILGVLKELGEEGSASLGIETGDSSRRSSLFWYVEAKLIDRLGEGIGGKLQTGRSHNDIMPTVSRLTARASLIGVVEALVELQGALLRVAREHVRTVMPGYTSLQHGQPWTLGHYLAGWDCAFARDFTRLRSAYETVNLSPLGASALVGTSWPLDRRRTAELLGFDGIMVNSRDAGFGTRDYVVETLAAIAITMSNLNALCSDLFLWSSYEFGMVELADGFCGTSSFMPQKKNAWAVDWARGAAGEVVGLLVSALAALRGASSTDGAFQDYPEATLPEAFELATDYLRLIAGVVDTLKVDADRMLDRARANWTTASNLAETIARELDVSFRSAHGVVARVVRNALEEGTQPEDLTAAMVARAAQDVGIALGDLTDEAVHAALDPMTFVESRVTTGSVRPEEVEAMLAEGFKRLDGEGEWLSSREESVHHAHQELRRLVDGYIGRP